MAREEATAREEVTAREEATVDTVRLGLAAMEQAPVAMEHTAHTLDTAATVEVMRHTQDTELEVTVPPHTVQLERNRPRLVVVHREAVAARKYATM